MITGADARLPFEAQDSAMTVRGNRQLSETKPEFFGSKFT